MSKFEDEPHHQLDEDDFTNAMQGIKPLKQDKIHFGKDNSKQNKALQANKYEDDRTSDNKPNLKNPAVFHFSDEYEPLITSNQTLSYVEDGFPAYYTKLLRRGDVRPEVILDLHGYNKEQTKFDLAAMIKDCKIKHIPCACVVHGVGGGILKAKLPHYLIQHPDVIALHQAPLEWGGQGAIVFIINIGEELEYILNR
ncbi:endonuclease SmrB [uncultured Psychrosphaera sp.]|jgi:DNA-nicking Smr family endonuclease|uniref:endonuclease SmrB n=1 Tax=uncultured Psychrosphaera sp. TaxID=1403522 RepID=UPI0026190D53|nr:endonuclease SmrB [uncultured Psychrosphaera sp.]